MRCQRRPTWQGCGKGSVPRAGVLGTLFPAAAVAAGAPCSAHTVTPLPLPQGSEGSEDDDGVEMTADAQGRLEASGALNSDDDSESCPICLNTFRGQVVGTPQSCAHYFCLDCIVEWSKVRWLLSGVLPPSGRFPLSAGDPACGWPLAGQLCSVAEVDHTVVLTWTPASLALGLHEGCQTHVLWGPVCRHTE